MVRRYGGYTRHSSLRIWNEAEQIQWDPDLRGGPPNRRAYSDSFSASGVFPWLAWVALLNDMPTSLLAPKVGNRFYNQRRFEDYA